MEFHASTIVLGIITGLGYGLLSAGLVIVYRTNRIINFAHGEIGALGAAVFVLAVTRWGLPYYVMFPIALAVGAGVGAMAEVAVIRRLRNAPRLMSLVATLGLGQLLFVITATIASSARGAAFYPAPPGLPQFHVGNLLVQPAASGLLFFSPVVVVALALFLQRSRLGLALRSAAANPEAARMAGVSASRMSTLAWAIGGVLSAFTAILVAPSLPGGLYTAASSGPSLLTRGLAGAIVARMTNLPVALAAGVGIGVTEGVLLQNFRSGGLMDLTLFAIIVVTLLFRSREGSREEDKGSAWATVQPWRPLPEAVAKLWAVRNLGTIIGLGALAVLSVAPLMLGNVTAVSLTVLLGFLMVALSVGIITGLGGQLTLGQFALAAVGATVSAQIATRTGGNLPLALLYGGLAAAAVTIVIGLPALRLKGLFLAVTTLAFAVAMANWVLIQPWAMGGGISTGRPVIAGRTVEPGRGYYYIALLTFVVLFLVCRNIRRTGFGRLLLAVRDNEDAARAFGLNVRWIKIQGFVLAGFIAGVGGAAYGHSYSEIGRQQFAAEFSVDVVVMTVVGGIGMLAGPVLGVLFVRGIPAFVPLDSLALLASRLGLLLLIMYFPGGVVQLISPLRERVVRWVAARYGVVVDGIEPPVAFEEATPIVSHAPAATNGHRTARGPREILRVSSVQRSYGGLRAVDDVSLEVAEGEIVGLIGPNGAGKTTLFEVIAGFVAPDGGRVVFRGEDVTRWTPERKAKAGLIRSFQDVALFPTLSVLETVQLALEMRVPTRFMSSVLGLTGRDRRREEIARDIVGTMGLWSFRNKQIQELSTGTRRICELACLVALRPKLLLLDEPSSGIAQRETEALAHLLADLKERYSMTLLVIEHDIPLIMGLSDRVIAMDAGQVIAHGRPDVVRNDPKVVEAYLGGRLEAIERSGTGVPGEAEGEGDVSVLAAIPGLGNARIAALLEEFGSVDAMREAGVEELSRVRGVGPALATKVAARLNGRVDATT
ncbi:MAG TPA: ATP-binding cassette domain-containing protein [Actinomycetota bacterium]|nr:ATP-binding cassette domain-containing protein [Actinomycetota bacterium]